MVRHILLPLSGLRARVGLMVSTAIFVILPSIPSAYGQLKFAAIGNYGFDPSGQKQVAETLKKAASQERISFIVSPGSNFPGGVSGGNDTKWQESFEDVYSDEQGSLKMPFLTVLGSDDWSGNYTAMRERTDLVYGDGTEKETASNSPKWTLPNWWYHYAVHFAASTGDLPLLPTTISLPHAISRAHRVCAGQLTCSISICVHFESIQLAGSAFISSGHKDMSVGLVFIDTWVLSSSFPFGNVTEKAWVDLETTLEIAPKVFDYIIVVGNRPVYSSGSSKGDSMLQYYLLPLLKKAGVDAYVSGYDHDMELIEVCMNSNPALLNQPCSLACDTVLDLSMVDTSVLSAYGSTKQGSIGYHYLIQDEDIAHINCGTGSVAGSGSLVTSSGSKFFSGDRGFCLFELTADGLITKFVSGETGSTLYEHKQPVKTRPERSTIDQFNYLSELPEVTYYPVPAMGKLPGKDVFVRVVGTIGLCIMTFLGTLTIASSVSKAMK